MHTVLYHRADLDGHCSGAIAALSLRQRQLDFKLHGIDYGDPIPWDLIDGHDLIVLDWSFQPWELFSEVLRRAKSLVWIDHHKTALAGLTEAMAGLLFTPSAKSMFAFAILVLVLLFRPQGIMGKRAAP